MSIGERVREAREAAKLSVVELAARAGLKPSTLYDLERGDSKSTTKLHRIAAATGYLVEYLETGRGPKTINSAADAAPRPPATPAAAALIAAIQAADSESMAGVWKHVRGLIEELSRPSAGAPVRRSVAGAKPTPAFAELMQWARTKPLTPADISELMGRVENLQRDRGGRNRAA